jgi:hypothetical protein
MPVNVRIPDDLRDRIDAVRLDGVSFADAPKRQPWIEAALTIFLRDPRPGMRVAAWLGENVEREGLASHDDTGAPTGGR